MPNTTVETPNWFREMEQPWQQNLGRPVKQCGRKELWIA